MSVAAYLSPATGVGGCNPRQMCFSATPNNPVCNAAPTSWQCPTMENFNPRQECLAKLSPTPPVSISGVEGGPAGGNRAYAGQPGVMRVRGQNVGMVGNTVVGEQGLVVGLVPLPNCVPPNCLGLSVLGAPNATGARRFTLRAWHGIRNPKAWCNWWPLQRPRRRPSHCPLSPISERWDEYRARA